MTDRILAEPKDSVQLYYVVSLPRRGGGEKRYHSDAVPREVAISVRRRCKRRDPSRKYRIAAAVDPDPSDGPRLD